MRRISAKDALNHPFIKVPTTSSSSAANPVTPVEPARIKDHPVVDVPVIEDQYPLGINKVTPDTVHASKPFAQNMPVEDLRPLISDDAATNNAENAIIEEEPAVVEKPGPKKRKSRKDTAPPAKPNEVADDDNKEPKRLRSSARISSKLSENKK